MHAPCPDLVLAATLTDHVDCVQHLDRHLIDASSPSASWDILESMQVVKPKRLRKADTVAVVSPSWGGPSLFPRTYEAGIRVLEEVFDLKIREFPTARMDAADLYRHPHLRAKDLNDAFADPNIQAIFPTIGGDDSVRVLPFLDAKIALQHPKLLMGFSDSVTLLTFYNQAGLVTFHGPSIMAGFAQARSMTKAFEAHVKSMLFGKEESHHYEPYQEWSEGYPNWKDPDNAEKVNTLRKRESWKWLQGHGTVRGRLFGGCIEVLEFLKGTRFWPREEFWKGRILFVETSEDKPSPTQVTWMFRNYGMQGVFERIRGILVGRPRGYSDAEKEQLNTAIVRVVSTEFNAPDLPIVVNMDFGHTDPQVILPLGIMAEINCAHQRVNLVESPTSS